MYLIYQTFAKASPLHSAAIHNLRNNNRFVGTRITNNTSIKIKIRDDKERKGVSEVIWKLLQYQGAPEIVTDMFSGNPLEYPIPCVNVQPSSGEESKLSNRENNKTIKVYQWWSKELIQHCIYLPPETGYKTALRLLNSKYGNPYYLLALYRKEINALPSAKTWWCF